MIAPERIHAVPSQVQVSFSNQPAVLLSEGVAKTTSLLTTFWPCECGSSSGAYLLSGIEGIQAWSFAKVASRIKS
jgi:hypothetical protein